MTVDGRSLVERMFAPPDKVRLRLIVDLSDLVVSLADPPNATGIQRVQSAIVLAMLGQARPDRAALLFVCSDARADGWSKLPHPAVERMVHDLALPVGQRACAIDQASARDGVLPLAEPFDASGELDDAVPSVWCLLGAAWLRPGYLADVAALQRRHGIRLVAMVHDLIPAVAPGLCDPSTIGPFMAFMRRALVQADHLLAVSETTARDIRRLAASLMVQHPPLSVMRNGLGVGACPSPAAPCEGVTGVPARFVLCVSTIERRQNHAVLLDVWRRLVEAGGDPPALVCVGRVGWGAESFLAGLVESDSLGGRIILLDDIDDATRQRLYAQCLFTIYPSLDEGWGLPVDEALAAGKICLCGRLAARPEVAGDGATYIDVTNADAVLAVVHHLISDENARRAKEAALRRAVRPIGWNEVAAAVIAAYEGVASDQSDAPPGWPAVTYGTEIGFGSIDLECDRSDGMPLLSRLQELRAGHLLSRPVTRAALLTGEAMRADGHWGEPEPWGVWLLHGPGAIVFALPPDPSEGCVVALRLRGQGIAGDIPLRLVKEGVTMWKGRLGAGSQPVVFHMPRDAGHRAGWWRVRLHLEPEIAPDDRAAIHATDHRIPLIGLERLAVLPGHDDRTRA